MVLRKWSQYHQSEKLRHQAYKGVLPQVRGQVWLHLLDIEKVKARNPGKYQGLTLGVPSLPGADRWESPPCPGLLTTSPDWGPTAEMKEATQVSSWDIKQIDLDMNKTFRNHIMFWDHLWGQQAPFHVLSAYSVYSTVSYCQDTSQIVAILLMFLTEEDAFWALAQLMTNERHTMHGFPKLLRFQCSPRKARSAWGVDKASAHSAASLESSRGAPFSLPLKLRDAYILDGERMLTAVAYTILKVHSRPEEFPMMPLGLEQVSPEPRPLHPSPSIE
ncbi:USP6 N-terminal-like protein [Vulpes lagopus]